MLLIKIPAREYWDESKNEFVYTKEQTLKLEHSLVSLSKWESKWCKAFLSKKAKTYEETIDYIKCMTLTQNVDPEVYGHLTDEHIRQINSYIDAPMTATYFSEEDSKSNRDVITAEIIYYWMISLQMPVELCQKWHLNRLLTLIKVINIKNSPPKKRSRREAMQHTAETNAARRRKHRARG